MKKKLVKHIERCLKSCAKDHSRIWFDQAFGAVEFAIAISSEKDFEKLDALWEEYREKFIEMIWGA
jgi:hypothetical protein